MNLQYCNGQKRHDFSTDEGFHYPGCDPKYYRIEDLSPQAFRRAYVAALFAEDQRWLTAIEKYQMIVPGSPKNAREKARDTDAKAHLQEQVSAETYEDRKAFYTAWRDAPCCDDDCGRYCDQCPNDGIKFKSVRTYGLDADIRRFIIKYGHYQTASELEAELKEKEKSNARNPKRTGAAVLSGVRDGKSDNGFIRIQGQERDGLSGQPEEVASDQAERIEAMLSHPLSEEMVT